METQWENVMWWRQKLEECVQKPKNTQDFWPLLQAGRGQEGSSPEPLEGAGSCQDLHFRLLSSKAVRINKCLCFKAPTLRLSWWSSGSESAFQCRGCGFDPCQGTKILHIAGQLGPRTTTGESLCAIVKTQCSQKIRIKKINLQKKIVIGRSKHASSYK